MGILDKIVEWIAEQVMNLLDLISTSVLGALGCNMDSFLRYFPAAETMYNIFVALAIGLILLNWVWNLFKNFGLVAGLEAEDPVKLSIRSVLFIFLAYFSADIVNIALKIGGTPYDWILTSELPPLSFADFNSVVVAIIGVVANGGVALISLILLLILAYRRTKWRIENNNASFFDHEIQFSGLIGGENDNFENFKEFISEETPEDTVIEAEFMQMRRMRKRKMCIIGGDADYAQVAAKLRSSETCLRENGGYRGTTPVKLRSVITPAPLARAIRTQVSKNVKIPTWRAFVELHIGICNYVK